MRGYNERAPRCQRDRTGEDGKASRGVGIGSGAYRIIFTIAFAVAAQFGWALFIIQYRYQVSDCRDIGCRWLQDAILSLQLHKGFEHGQIPGEWQ